MLRFRVCGWGLAFLGCLMVSPVRAGYAPEVVSGSASAQAGVGELLIQQKPALTLATGKGGADRLAVVAANLQRVLAGVNAPPSAVFAGKYPMVLKVAGVPVLTVTPVDLSLWGVPAGGQGKAYGGRTAQALAAVERRLGEALSALPAMPDLKEKVYLGVGESQTLLGEDKATARWPVEVLAESAKDFYAWKQMPTGAVTLTGLGAGEGVLRLRKGTLTREVFIKCRYRAGLVTGPMRLFISSPPPPRADVLAMARAAIAANVFEREGAETSLAFQMPATLGAGNHAVPVTVKIGGANYFDLVSQTSLEVTVGQFTPMSPARLYMSNSPERVKGPQRLFEGVISAGVPVRFMLHHLNDSPQRQIYSVKAKNRGEHSVSLYWQGSTGGPSPHESFTGYVSGLGFLGQTQQGAGLGLTIAPGSQAIVQRYTVKPREVISSVQNLEAVGGDLELVVDAYTDSPGAGTLPNNHPELVFSYAEVPQEIEHATSDAWKYLSLGYLPESSGANFHHIKGNFGGTDRIKVRFYNDQDIARKVWIKFFPAAGYAGGVFLINRELVSVKPTPPPQEVTVYRTELQPGETREVSLQSLTLPGSNYPAKLIVAAEPMGKVVQRKDESE